MNDQDYMQLALQLAEAQLGRTAPNPAVGAVIVKNGRVVAQAATGRGGRPHAETQALEQAGNHAHGATLYVTLEPCNHHGHTPPCTDAIIAAGIARVVVACMDPNPHVSGKGIAQLRASGIEVVDGVCGQQAHEQHEGFFRVVHHKRPFVTLKLATSLDGKIAAADGESKWITNEASRMRGHLLRAQNDAIVTGISTVLSDDPQLTCRIDGRLEDSPQRIVLDRLLRIPPHANVLPAWIFTSEAAMHNHTVKVEALINSDSRIFPVTVADGHLILTDILHMLAEQGITRLMVEAGSSLSSAFVRANLVDRIYWFRAPLVLGENGLPALKGQDTPLAEAHRYHLHSLERIGDDDVLEVYDYKAK